MTDQVSLELRSRPGDGEDRDGANGDGWHDEEHEEGEEPSLEEIEEGRFSACYVKLD